ncbi:MAG: SPFH domain-containing protein [Rikenellaceae bacterium]
MEQGVVVLAFLAFVVVIVTLRSIKIIPQSETRIVERLGRYDRTLPSGINIIWPIVDQARTFIVRYSTRDAAGNTYSSFVKTQRIDLREQVYDFAKQNVITRDNVTTEINALLYFQIIDPVKAVYEIDNLPNAIEKLTQTTLRNVIGEMELDETLTSRDTINSKLRAVLDDATNKWGVKVNRVELQDITPPTNIIKAMEQQMQAERNRRAEILRAEGEKTSAILKSEGAKEAQINNAAAEKETAILKAQGLAEAQILQAKAEAEAIARISEAIAATSTNPATYILATKYIESLKSMVSGKDNKTIYMPYEATGVISSLGSLKDMFNSSK